MKTIEVGVAYGKDPHAVVEDAIDQLTEDPNLGLVFFSPKHIEEIESAVGSLPEGCKVIGCSTAGELTPDGYTYGTVIVALISSPYLAVETHRITFEREDPKHAREIGRNLVLGAMEKLRNPGPCLDINFNAMLTSLSEGRPIRALPYFIIELSRAWFPPLITTWTVSTRWSRSTSSSRCTVGRPVTTYVSSVRTCSRGVPCVLKGRPW